MKERATECFAREGKKQGRVAIVMARAAVHSELGAPRSELGHSVRFGWRS